MSSAPKIGEASEVPQNVPHDPLKYHAVGVLQPASNATSGTLRPRPAMFGTFFWYDGRLNTTDTPPPVASESGTFQPTSFVSFPLSSTDSSGPPPPMVWGVDAGTATLICLHSGV